MNRLRPGENGPRHRSFSPQACRNRLALLFGCSALLISLSCSSKENTPRKGSKEPAKKTVSLPSGVMTLSAVLLWAGRIWAESKKERPFSRQQNAWTTAGGITDGRIFRSINRAGKIWGRRHERVSGYSRRREKAYLSAVWLLAGHGVPTRTDGTPPLRRRTSPDRIRPYMAEFSA
jgi:hypothetical protein